MNGFPLVYTYSACPYVGIIQIRLRVGVLTCYSACCDACIGKLPLLYNYLQLLYVNS